MELKFCFKKLLQFEEVKIKLPYGGYIFGKWWGNRSIRPFLCIHGRQDNCGTFDRLIPLLSKEFSYLAIDFPGLHVKLLNRKPINFTNKTFL